jgi:hypothetical protein
MRMRWGRIRSAERVEAHLFEIEFCEPSFGPMRTTGDLLKGGRYVDPF